MITECAVCGASIHPDDGQEFCDGAITHYGDCESKYGKRVDQPCLVSDAMAVIRQAAIDGRMEVSLMLEFADELKGFALQQSVFRPETVDLDPLEAN